MYHELFFQSLFSECLTEAIYKYRLIIPVFCDPGKGGL